MGVIIRPYLLAISISAMSVAISSCGKECAGQVPPYWTFTTDKYLKYENRRELANIVHSILELKEQYRSEVQIIFRDSDTNCVIDVDVAKPGKMYLYVVVIPPNPEITSHLEDIGLTYVY